MAIKLVESYAISQLRGFVRDSLMTHGEEAILLAMYHVNADEDTVPRCSQCYDDIYSGGDQATCTMCYGTTFQGGVKSAQRVWAMFSDKAIAENLGQHGVWAPDSREIQCEPFPELMEHDFVVRVRTWDNHTPTELEGYYAISQVTRDSLRTGNRFGQWPWDVVGQRAKISELQSNSVIYQYPVLGQQFPDATIEPETPLRVSVQQPDDKIIYVNNHPIAVSGEEVFTYTKSAPSTIWTIPHTFDHFPIVTVIVGGVQVDADVQYPNPTTVVIVFASPQVGTAVLV